MQQISRRRMIAITACAAGAAMMGSSYATAKITPRRPVVWRGIALGAEAQIILYHENEKEALAILEQCRTEINRLENLFSLYRTDSSINRLNRDGQLASPAFEMLELLSLAQTISKETKGAFDITVQPLWNLYAKHFSDHGLEANGPDEIAVRDALELVDYRKLEFSKNKIELKIKGMGITLNGIAQGYITDRIAGLLQQNGFGNVLIDLGEIYGMGQKPAGIPWTVKIADPAGKTIPTKPIALENRAMATSGGYGTLFASNSQYHHLFDPGTGTSTKKYKSVTVIAKNAATADALSTAFSAMPVHDIKRTLGHFAGASAIIIQTNDEILEL